MTITYGHIFPFVPYLYLHECSTRGEEGHDQERRGMLRRGGARPGEEGHDQERRGMTRKEGHAQERTGMTRRGGACSGEEGHDQERRA